MKQTLTALILFFPLMISAYGQTGEEELVREVFDNYKTSVLNSNGVEAAEYVDSGTIEYYGRILNLVKNGDRAEIESLPFLDRLIILSIRHRTPKEDILSFDGRKLFIYAIDNGMTGKDGMRGNSIGEVITDGNYARGQLVVNEQAEPVYFDFYKENGQWKFDLTSLFPLTSQTLKGMADEEGESENEFIFSILELITGKKPGEEIWKPISK